MKESIKTKEKCKECNSLLTASFTPKAIGISPYILDCVCGHVTEITKAEYKIYKRHS